MNVFKVFAFMLALAMGVAFTAHAWAFAPVAGSNDGTVVKSMLKKVDDQPPPKTKKKKGKGKKKKKKGEEKGEGTPK